MYDNESVTVDFTLQESNPQLQEVEVAGRINPYKNEVTAIGTKTTTALKDVPQSISFVTSELMHDQNALVITDVVRNISGVNQESISGDYRIRGFKSSRIITINGLRIKKGWMPALISNMERIEVVKGANSALYGFSDPGGTINRVTKKPLKESKQGIRFSAGSFNTIRSEIDFTGSINKDKTVLYRLNVAQQGNDSFRDLQGRKDLLIAPSISFLPTEKTRIDLDLIYSTVDARVDRGQPFWGDPGGQATLKTTPITLTATLASSYNKENSLSLLGSISHEFSDKIKFNTSLITNRYNRDYLEQRTNNRYGVDINGNMLPTKMEGRFQRGERTEANFNLNSYFSFEVKTGAVEHNILVGYDYDRQTLLPGAWDIRLAGSFRNAANTGAIKSFDSDNPNLYLLDADGNPVPNMPYFDLENPNYNPQDYKNYFTKFRTRPATLFFSNGIYIQNQMKIGKLQVLLGLRQEFYRNFKDYKKEGEEKIKQKSLIPRIGAVFSITDNINIYGTYLEGFQPQRSNHIADPDAFGGPFDPLTSTMMEFGTKTEWFNKKLSITASVYEIEQNNILIDAEDPNNPDLLEQRGQETSTGVEFEINGQVLPNLSISANYSYNEALITESDNPDEVGARKEYAPLNIGGSWIKYNVNNGALDGLGLAFGSNFVSKQYTGADFFLPGYVVFDAAIYYKIGKVQLSANLYNLENKKYWIGRGRAGRGITANPGAPRNFLVSVGYSF
ncbi:MAG TPA: TonB-dependent siderophore receptor [Flavobacteriaceae bacterium]|nr:TonB-dependent siderophore receptor [Flavobacteriaceae bacterium]